MFKKKKDDCEFDIHLVKDKHKIVMDVSAENEESVLTALALLVQQMRERGDIAPEKIEYACKLGLGKAKNIDSKIMVKEIHVTKEQGEKIQEMMKNNDFEKLLNKLMEGDR